MNINQNKQKYGCKFARMLQHGETKPCCYVLGYGECQFLCEVGAGGEKYHFIIHTLNDCDNALKTISEGEKIVLPYSNSTVNNMVQNCQHILSIIQQQHVFKIVFDLRKAILFIASKFNKKYSYSLDKIEEYIVALKGISSGENIPLEWVTEDIDTIIYNCYQLANNDKIKVECNIVIIDDIAVVIQRIMDKLNGGSGYPQYPYCEIYQGYINLEQKDKNQSK